MSFTSLFVVEENRANLFSVRFGLVFAKVNCKFVNHYISAMDLYRPSHPSPITKGKAKSIVVG